MLVILACSGVFSVESRLKMTFAKCLDIFPQSKRDLTVSWTALVGLASQPHARASAAFHAGFCIEVQK